MSTRFYGVCPSCGSKHLTLDANPTYYDNSEGTKGMWQIVKCSGCTKKWKVTWDEEYVVDFWNKMLILECTMCNYQTRIKNPTQYLNYKAIHQQSGHTGMMLSEEEV